MMGIMPVLMVWTWHVIDGQWLPVLWSGHGIDGQCRGKPWADDGFDTFDTDGDGALMG